MFKLIELIKEARQSYNEDNGVVGNHRSYLQGKIDAYQHILDTEYPDWEDIYKFAKISKQNTK
jgi:hypothetical protein